MATSAAGWDNKFSTTLSSGITASDTTIPLTNLPTASEGWLVIEPDSSTAWEEIYYTSKTGSAVVCPSVLLGRGQGGSTAASHTTGATVRCDTTAEMFKALQDGTALATSAITTAKIAAAAVTDAKLVNGKLYRRQGGSSTVWTTQGTTNYDYSATNVIFQSGTILADANPKAVTFPVAFAQNPHVFVQVLTQTGANCYAIAASVSTTGFNVAVITDSGVANTGQTVNWMAIGQ